MSGYIDLNADVGEGEPNDHDLIALVSRCNIACGGHTGTAQTMKAALQSAKAAGVAAGAHPSYPDREGFGRKPMTMAPQALRESLAGQIGDLNLLAEAERIRLTHIKPHGALYHSAGEDEATAEILVELARSLVPGAAIVGPPDSALSRLTRKAGLNFLSEGFADRAYGDDGRLVPRSEPGAVLEDDADRVSQALDLAQGLPVRTRSGDTVRVTVDTICLHGDSPGALQSARQIRAALERAGLIVGPGA